MNLEQHLAHLIALLAPPYREAWRAYVWDRAQQLAKEPELETLPRLLAEAMKPNRSSGSPVHGTPADSSQTGGL